MSKHRHSKDKLHLTYTQIHNERKQKKVAFEQLPFYCCALSLAPFQDPVCTPQGHVFDLLYIMPFIKKYQRNPVTGAPLKTSQLIKMNWTRSQNRNNPIQYQDPISYKIFTEYTHIVCIKASGYVYAYDTIQELNKKPKFYRDLVTDQEFQLSDIIHIQDPKNAKNRKVQQFDYLKNNLPFVQIERLQPEIMENETIEKVMKEVSQNRKKLQQARKNQDEQKLKKKAQLQDKKDVNSFIKWGMQSKIFKHQRETDMSSVSLTSTSWTPNLKGETTFRELKKAEIRNIIYEKVKKKKLKGFVQIATNLGNMNFLIHADLVPKASQNFIELAESGYYDNCSFHRLAKDHCLQGGDPTGTGSGGNSIFGNQFEDEFHPKLSHNKVGILSMANSGPHSNKSQFFITLSMNKDLDEKHSVFGQIISNQDLLFQINREYVGKGEKPKHPIVITKIFCYDNPFRKAIKQIKSELLKDKKLTQEVKMEKEKQRWLDDDNKFNLPKNIDRSQQKGQGKESSLADKLLNDFL